MTSSNITPIRAASDGGAASQTAIEIPDYVTMITPAGKRAIDTLAEYAADLLAANSDLPAPVYFSVSEFGQEVSLQFGDSRDSFRVLAQWAGGAVRRHRHRLPYTRDGQRSVHCQVMFTDHGVKVEAYAFITASKAAPAAT